MGKSLDIRTGHAVEAMDRLIARFLPSWEGGAAVKAKEIIVEQHEEIKRLESDNARLQAELAELDEKTLV